MNRRLRFLPTATPPRRPANEPQIPHNRAANLSPEPFPRLPVGGQKGVTPLTVSAPNSSQKYNSLQNRGPSRPRASRSVGRSRQVDVSPHHDPDRGCLNVFEGGRKRLIIPCRSTSCTPTSSVVFVPFCHRCQISGRVLHPRLKQCSVISGRTGAFQQSVHRFCPREGHLPLFQLAHDPFDASSTKLNLLYTPRTAWTPSIFRELGRGRPARPPCQGLYKALPTDRGRRPRDGRLCAPLTLVTGYITMMGSESLPQRRRCPSIRRTDGPAVAARHSAQGAPETTASGGCGGPHRP